MIQNFPITASGISNDRNMFGPNLAVTRNKTVQKNPDRQVMDYIDVSKYFLKLQKFVTLVVDMMSVNSAPLLSTMACGIKFLAV